MLGLFALAALQGPQTCAEAYADLRARLAKVRSVAYSTYQASTNLPNEWSAEIGVSRTGRMYRNVDSGPGIFTHWETDGRRLQTLDPAGSSNVAFQPTHRRLFWLPGFESLSDPAAKVEGIGDVRTKDGAVLLDLRVYDQNLTLYLDPETRLPLGHGTAEAMTIAYARSRREDGAVDLARLRYDVPFPKDPLPAPSAATAILTRTQTALRKAREVRIVRYRNVFWDGRALPRRWDYALENRIAGGAIRDTITVRGKAFYRREAEGETIVSDGKTVVRRRKGRPPVTSRAPRQGLPERIAGFDLLFEAVGASLPRDTLPVEIVDALPRYQLTPSYFLPLGSATLRVTATDGRPGELFVGHTVFVFQYPEPGETPHDPVYAEAR